VTHKIIFINRYFYSDHSATSQLLSDLAFAMRLRKRRSFSNVKPVVFRLEADGDAGKSAMARDCVLSPSLFSPDP